MKKKFNYRQFDIGDWVKVKRQVYVISNENIRKNIFLPERVKPKIGMITGVKVLREGKINYPKYGVGLYDDDSTTFTHTNTIICWEIRTGLTNKPIYALPEDLKLCSISDIKYLEIPILDGNFDQWETEWAKKYKKDLSEDSKSWPRDSKGRWVGGSK